MPDKWEYPWYAAWDLAFHMIPMARIDPHFAKEQLALLLREWYMHPNGQIPGVRVGVRRRESAGARVGRVARLQDDRPARPARSRVPRTRVSEVAHQLHVVGESQGPRGPQPVRRRLSRPRQHRRVRSLASRCPRADTSSRPTARRGWRSTATPCSRWRSSSRATTPRTRTWRPSSSSTSSRSPTR